MTSVHVFVELQTILVKYEITVENGSETHLAMSVQSALNQSAGLLEVCSLAVVDVGENIPCIRKERVDQEISSRCALTKTHR